MTYIPTTRGSGPVTASVDTTNATQGDGVQPAAPNRSTTNTQSLLANKINVLNQGTQPPAKDGR